MTLALTRDFAFHGRLVDADKNPVAGARVRVVEVAVPDSNDLPAALDRLKPTGWSTVWESPGAAPFARRVRGWYEPLPGLRDVWTDGAGGFAITGIGADRLATLLVEGPGLVTAEVRVLIQPGETVSSVPLYRHNFAFQMDKGRIIWGTVTDFDSGRPLAGAAVRGVKGRLGPRAITDAEGRYRLDGLVRENPELLIEGPPGTVYFPLTRYAATSSDGKERVLVDARLTRCQWLTGRVVETRTNKPVAGARVEYYPHADNTGPGSTMEWEPRPDGKVARRGGHSEAVSGPDGWFRIRAAPGRGWVLVKNLSFTRYIDARQRYIQGEKRDEKPPDWFVVKGQGVLSWDYTAIAAVNVDPELAADLTITLETGVWPEVRFVDPDGKPLAGVRTQREPTFNPDGPPSRIAAFHPDRRLGIGFQPPAADPGPWTVQLQPLTTVTARLLRKNGEPIANDDVFVNPSRAHGAPLSPRDWKFRTDKDGRVRFTDIIVGAEYDLWCAGLAEKIWDKRIRPFVAKPGPLTDLGTIVGGQPRE
jgi:protocatechuate 3,4-dioxygenase beta subunit